MTARRPHRIVAELAILREAHAPRISRAAIAEACGVTEDAVGNWERGTSNPLLHHLVTYAAAVGARLNLTGDNSE